MVELDRQTSSGDLLAPRFRLEIQVRVVAVNEYRITITVPLASRGVECGTFPR
jgi:hypothetical protein